MVIKILEEAIKMFNDGKDLRGRVDPAAFPAQNLALACLYVLSDRNEMMSRDDLVQNVNWVAAGNYNERQVRDMLMLLRRQGAMIYARGGEGGGYRRARGWEDIEEYTEDVLYSQAMSLLQTRSKVLKKAREVYGPKQEKMVI